MGLSKRNEKRRYRIGAIEPMRSLHDYDRNPLMGTGEGSGLPAKCAFRLRVVGKCVRKYTLSYYPFDFARL